MTYVLTTRLESVQVHRFEAQILVLQIFRHFVNNRVLCFELVISNDINKLVVFVYKIASIAPVRLDFNLPIVD